MRTNGQKPEHLFKHLFQGLSMLLVDYSSIHSTSIQSAFWSNKMQDAYSVQFDETPIALIPSPALNCSLHSSLSRLFKCYSYVNHNGFISIKAINISRGGAVVLSVNPSCCCIAGLRGWHSCPSGMCSWVFRSFCCMTGPFTFRFSREMTQK